jgi:hypothetical protein
VAPLSWTVSASSYVVPGSERLHGGGPQPFREDVASPPPRPIHTDLNSVVVQESDECLARELAALIGVENLWATIPGDRLLHDFHAEIHGQRI